MTVVTASVDDHNGGKAAKVLVAAEELIVRQGFRSVTMAAVAQRAHVGKGTPYLYWRTKEDLFLELISGNLADVLDDLAARVQAEPALASPERLCPALAAAWLARPLVRALQFSDVDVLGALVDEPRTHAIVAENGATAILRTLLPVWRDHGAIGTDSLIDDQAAALEIVLIGYFATEMRGTFAAATVDRAAILRRSILALLHVDMASGSDRSALATEVAAVLENHAHQLRASTSLKG